MTQRAPGQRPPLDPALTAAALDGRPAPAPVRSPAPRAARAGPQLEGPLTRDTVIPSGQRCGQQLRRFFRDEIGAHLRFDGRMRRFVRDWHAATPGGRHADALAAWRVHRALPVDGRP